LSGIPGKDEIKELSRYRGLRMIQSASIAIDMVTRNPTAQDTKVREEQGMPTNVNQLTATGRSELVLSLVETLLKPGPLLTANGIKSPSKSTEIGIL